METGDAKRRRREGGRTSETFSCRNKSLRLQHTDANTIFALLLAAIFNSHRPDSLSLIKKCLVKVTSSFLSQNPNPILSLLPFILTAKKADIVTRGLEIVGSASLFSLEMNERIALDEEIMKGLVSALGSSNRNVSMAACNAVLDMSTTLAARQRLLEFSALESLMFGLLQVPKGSLMRDSLCIVDDGSITCCKIGFEEDEFPVLLFTATIILINSCNIELLEKIPKNLSESFLAFLKMLWAKARNEMLVINTLKSGQAAHVYESNIRINNLAESIFRLSISSSRVTTTLPLEVVERSIFGLSKSSFQDFLLTHWEESPFLIERLSSTLNEGGDVFSSFAHSLRSTETVPSFLSSILRNLVSCFPIASDELDILSFLKDVENKLGCPIIYQQDIRVLRTESQLKTEVHFFQESLDSCCKKDSHIFNIDEIRKCEEAYKEGYTVAVRGMEFRFDSIAAIANGLAFLFGQPSVGVNMYLTPPNSQGLVRHFDDHCVFVCQIFGTKQWSIFPPSDVQLPRLYDPLGSLHGAQTEVSVAECRKILLKEGDILYIPRGFPHEACTDGGGLNGSAGCSLHLTLGIEVEPPFEWEGFAHVALYCWNQCHKKPHYASCESVLDDLHIISVNLLHVAIGILGDSDPTFRKACLVAAVPLLSDTRYWLDLNQRTIFSHLIEKINAESCFSQALRTLEVGIQKNEDPFQRIRWLRFLKLNEETTKGRHRYLSFMEASKLFSLCVRHREKVEASFMQLKARFCDEAVYANVLDSYKMLLDKYRKARKQYLDGMISLQCTS